jgi:hypothetical protein
MQKMFRKIQNKSKEKVMKMSNREELIIPEKYKGKELFSFSRISTYDNCKREFFYNYIQKLPNIQNIYGQIGGDVHDLTQRLQRKEITNEYAVKRFNQDILKAELLGLKFPNEKVKQNFVECILHFLKNYKVIEAKQFEIEKELFATIGFTDTLFLGYLDILYFYNDGIIEIQDYKTSTMFSTKEIPKKSRQLILYAYALAKSYNIKVNSIKFNMLKYLVITWKGKTKVRSVNYPRNKFIEKMSKEFKKDLQEIGKNDLEIAFILSKAQTDNEIPKEIANKYTITDCLIEVSLNDCTIKEMENFIDDIVIDINSRNKNNESEWYSCDIEKNSFYCSILCGQRKNCSVYKQFCEDNADKFTKKEENNSIKELFGMKHGN